MDTLTQEVTGNVIARNMTSIGFAPVPDWRSTYWHPDLQLLLMVYVDGFKMAGPRANFAKGWSLIRKKIKTDEPHAVTKCLECEHLVRDTNVGGVSVKQVEYNIRPFFEQCVDSYLTLIKKTFGILKPAKTPFLDESKVEKSSENKEGLLAHCMQGPHGNSVWSSTGKVRFTYSDLLLLLLLRLQSGILFAI